MSLPPITGALTTACAALAALTTVVAFAALGSTGDAVPSQPNPHAPRLWKSRMPPIASASVQRASVPARAVAPKSEEGTCFLVDPLAPTGSSVVHVLGLPLALVRVPVTDAAPSSAPGESAAASCEAQRVERSCERPCGSKAAPALD